MLIKELVHMDEYGSFRSDVQLSDYDNPSLNLELLNNYIFTVSAPITSQAGRDVAAKDVLDMLKNAFTIDRSGSDFNRMVLTANYGRGKSHLALVLANLLSRPANSKEVEIIFERLGQALNNSALLKGYREFKETKGEFLVMRLRGDAISDLQEGFLRALEQALKEHASTRGVSLPFWYAKAEEWLTAQSQETLKKIDSYLHDKEHTDLATLRQDYRKAETYELIREAIKYATGLYPDFGRELNLTELIHWAVNEVCIPNHLGGLLILFDEFSLFLQKYAASRTPGKLQELLNGISNHPGKSAFLAFTQLDIESVVETYAHGNRREDVKRELDRLPRDRRARLFSLMEGVLEAYLKQDDAAWNVWWNQKNVKPMMVRNREMLFTYFPRRYNDALKWDHGMVEKIVVRGCYPLHPLTTAILSTHTFEAGAGENPRTALHFVRDRWNKGISDQPAEREDGTPNFIFAVELVDFFGEQISKRWYEAYRYALENSPISLTEDHKAVLKALLLQRAVSELSSEVRGGSEQNELLSNLSGVDLNRVPSLLGELTNNRVIQKNGNTYSLFPIGARSHEADRIIGEAVQKIPVDYTLLEDMAKKIPPFTIPQNFGNPDDWAPRQVVLIKEYFEPETLQELTSRYRVGKNGIEESPRGMVIWLLARSEEEKMWFRQNAQALLDSVSGMKPNPLPVLIILPHKVNPGLLNAAQRIKALMSLNQSEREKIGSIIWNDEKTRTEIEIKTGLYTLLGDIDHYSDLDRQFHEYILPGEYLASVQTLRKHSIKEVLTECYRQAYQHRVEFSDKPVITKGVNHLRTAVENITRGLFEDTVGLSIRNLKNQDVQYTVAVEYLTKKWGLLDLQNYNIQPPTSRSLREAWNRLESAFPPGCRETSAREILIEFLNPPYGHDYNTLTLLLAAWIGFHRYEIQLSLEGRLKTLEEFKEIFNNSKGPKGFLDTLITQGFTIRRIDIEERFMEIDAIIDQIRQKDSRFSILEAGQALKKLEQAQSNPHLPANRMELIKTYRPLLEQDLARAQEYDRQIGEWLSQLHSADVEKLLTMGDSLRRISFSDLVVPSKPSLSVLRKEWETRLEHELELYCKRYSEITDLSHYTANENQLQKVLKQVQEYPILVSRVQKALELLKQRQQDLRQRENEKTIAAEIQNMVPSARLVTLYEYCTKLTELQNLSTETENLRKSKLEQIESRIRQFETLVASLPLAVEKAKSLDELREQKTLLLRNVDQTQDTPLYQQLEEIQNRIERLERFFESLRDIASLPCRTPSDLDTISQRIHEIENQYSNYLSQAQREILNEQRRQVDNIRQQEEQKARQWLIDLSVRFTNGAKPDELLRIAQNPPEFLPSEDRSKLNQLTQLLRQKVEKDTLLKIEMLFKELNTDTRRECLKRLQELVEQL